MPIYCYECERCLAQREVLTLTVDTEIECKDCGIEMKKVPALSSFRLKGEGWAMDNYSKGGNDG